MTEYIAHRINTITELKSTPQKYGVELDLRDEAGEIVLQHDPFLPASGTTSELFSDYLEHYKHGTLILNVKSERIEHRVLELVKKYKIENYFFLDSSFPMIYLLSTSGEKKCAIRFSEFEGLDTVMTMQNKINWVWVDCFTQLPITQKNYARLKQAGFRLCLVSPELQGRPEDIERYRQYLASEQIEFDAICTKTYNIPKWQKVL